MIVLGSRNQRKCATGGSFEDYSAQNIPTAEKRKRKLFLLFKIKSPQYTFFTPSLILLERPLAAPEVRQCQCTNRCTIHVFVFHQSVFIVQSMSLFLSDPGSFTDSCC